MTHLRIWGLAALLVTGLLPVASGSVPPSCAIIEGTAIGGIRLGMTARAALAITGTPLRQQADGSRVRYVPRAPWSEMIAEYDVIERVSTQSPACVTAGGIGPGSVAAAVREAYAGAPASLITTAPDGTRISYPFSGVDFLLRGGRVDSVEIYLPARTAGTRLLTPPAASSPFPLVPAAASWSIRSSSWRLEDTTFVVTGVVENRGPPSSAFAEVSAFGPSGRMVGSSDGPLDPAPLPAGGAATFEARLSIDDVVSRYSVIVRPVGSISVALAQQSVEVRRLQAFAPLVMRKLRVAVEFRSTPTRFLVTATNESSATIITATIAVDIAGTCFIRLVDQVRAFGYRGGGFAVVSQIAPGGSALATLPMPPDSAGICLDLATAVATPRVIDIRIGE